MRARRIGMIVAAALAAGCGEVPTLDATSDRSITDSLTQMARELPEPERADLMRSVVMLTMRSAVPRAFQSAARRDAERMPTTASELHPYHGMTAAELIARAKASPGN